MKVFKIDGNGDLEVIAISEQDLGKTNIWIVSLNERVGYDGEFPPKGGIYGDPGVCGNGFCEAWAGENPGNCQKDCPPKPVEPENPNDNDGNGGGGNGGSGGDGKHGCGGIGKMTVTIDNIVLKERKERKFSGDSEIFYSIVEYDDEAGFTNHGGIKQMQRLIDINKDDIYEHWCPSKFRNSPTSSPTTHSINQDIFSWNVESWCNVAILIYERDPASPIKAVLAPDAELTDCTDDDNNFDNSSDNDQLELMYKTSGGIANCHPYKNIPYALIKLEYLNIVGNSTFNWFGPTAGNDRSTITTCNSGTYTYRESGIDVYFSFN